jgi:phenylalanyl-tRNA synthetase alpha chain
VLRDRSPAARIVSAITDDAARLVDEAGGVARQAGAAAGAATDTATLEVVERAAQQALAAIKRTIKDLDAADRAPVGRALQEATAAVRAAVDDRRAALDSAADTAAAASGRIDLTATGTGYRRGHLHPVTQVWRELEDIFCGLGYEVHYGPEVEDDWHNFEALNFPPGHPARAMQDTLYVQLGEPEQVLLRTHTSPMQVRLMETHAPPIYAIIPGRTFRRDTPDARHSPVFHQIECLVVDRHVTMGDLMGTIDVFFRALFGDVEARFVPSFFPFTEPSAELSVSCPFCKRQGCRTCSSTGWIELGGCGMVDPNVFLACGIDPEVWSGFAFGFGIDRIPLLRNEIDSLQTLLWDNDLRFLRQF